MAEFVDKLVKEHKVVIFSKTYCPYCVKAKNVFNKYNINDIVIVELDDLKDADSIQGYLSKLTGARTVPRVFINGKCIGGGDDSVNLHNSNKLKPMLESCGALA